YLVFTIYCYCLLSTRFNSWRHNMTLRLSIAFVLVVSFSSAVWSGDAKDSDAIQGTWLPTSAELAGNPVPDEFRKAIKLVVKDSKYTVTFGKVTDQGSVKLDASAKPKAIDT